MTQTDEVLVLKLIEYGEKDWVVSMLTKSHGKISAFARGARGSRKRFSSSLDLFVLGKAELAPPRSVESGMWRLQGLMTIDPFLGIRKDLNLFSYATYLSECLSMLSGEGERDRVLFDWWKAALTEFSNGSVSSHRLIRLHLQLFEQAGYGPEWSVCAECKNEPFGDPLFFSFAKGGIVCKNCRHSEEGRWINRDVANFLRSEALETKTSFSQIQGMLDAFSLYILGREPKSLSFRNEVMKFGS